MNYDLSQIQIYQMVGCPMIKAHDPMILGLKKRLERSNETAIRKQHPGSPGPAVHAAPYRPLRCYFHPPPPMTLGKCEKSHGDRCPCFPGAQPQRSLKKCTKLSAVLMESTGKKSFRLVTICYYVPPVSGRLVQKMPRDCAPVGQTPSL